MASNIKTYSPDFAISFGTSEGFMAFSGDVVRIQTHSTCRDVCNTWRMTLVPREDKETGISDYDRIEPMTYCEISFKRETKDLVPIMRGFVTNVSKSVDFSSGKPNRSIEISGENYGKIIKMAYIHYLYGFDPAQIFGASGTFSPLFFGYGLDILSGRCTPSAIVNFMWEKIILKTFNNVIDKTVDRTSTGTSPSQSRVELVSSIHDAVGDFILDMDISGTDGVRPPAGIPNPQSFIYSVADQSIASTDTSVLDVLNQFSGKPYTELFCDDAPDATYLVYRPVPWRDRDGGWVGTTSFSKVNPPYTPKGSRNVDALAKGEPIEIDAGEIVSFNVGRNDEEVFNYILIDSSVNSIGPPFEALAMNNKNNKNPHFTADTTGGAIPQSPKLEYSRMDLFGFRKFLMTSPFISINPNILGDAHEIAKAYGISSDSISTDSSMLNVGDQLALILFNAMEHVSQLEQGNMTIRGREDIRPGMYVSFKDERIDKGKSVFYVTDVEHSFIPFESWVTQLSISRGEAHLNRIKDKERFKY